MAQQEQQFKTNENADHPPNGWDWAAPRDDFEENAVIVPCRRFNIDFILPGFRQRNGIDLGDVLSPQDPPAEGGADAYMLLYDIRTAIHGRVVKGAFMNKLMIPPYWQVCTTNFCAIKVMSKEKIQIAHETGSPEDPMKEIVVMQLLEDDQPENLMYPMDVLEDETSIYIVMPYMRYDLHDLITNERGHGRLPEHDCRFYFRQLLDGIGQMQRRYIFHRDLSLENVVVDENERLRIIDFAQCVRVPFRREQRMLMYRIEDCGKEYCMSPEVYRCRVEQHRKEPRATPYDGFAADLYSAGIILYCLAVGDRPWRRPHETDQDFNAIANGRLVALMESRNYGLSPDLMNLLQRMLIERPTDRLCLAQVRAHPWMNS